ncbi:ABC transporter substrate-binding protein [Caballeronia ptereochthonis]|uniref:ABC transporter substrate binding protein n=1 Tax=Caballeronia ptereochthonis TaxID=1777144 RepID=A0A158EAX4_9BURK|nr:ABC transporter substrate-binding protein [Caballeronia ptereochthonis]SAL04015.1 ABC transporter substrate binding protein [Caballeronia ptereochthonis]
MTTTSSLNRLFATLALMAAFALPMHRAHAEGNVRIVDQYGIGSLLLKVVKDQKLIEKEGARSGLDIDVQWNTLSGGAAMNEALLSGAADIATIGIGPLMTIWDRTLEHQAFRAMAAQSAVPVYLVSNDPRIRSIGDVGEKDRIAVVSVAVSQQGRLLQMASARAFGDANYARLDRFEVNMPHADATTAMLSGNSLINLHFSNAPYQYQELEDRKIHKVISSTDILGGPSTGSVVVTSAKWRKDNPKTYAAVRAALEDAAKLVGKDKAQAAAIYIRQDGSKLSPAFVERILNDGEASFSTTPQNTLQLGTFLHKVGVIRHEPKSWRDYFFADDASAQGS